MKSLINYINEDKRKRLSSFLNEARLTPEDIEQIASVTRYYVDSFCLKSAAIEFFNMILNDEDKNNVVAFMHKISYSVASFNDNAPSTFTKYVKSETNVTDADWRGWYTSVKGYVTHNDWEYDNQGEKNDFYDRICSDGGDTSWTALNKKACEHLYDMFMEFFKDKSVIKTAIKQWKTYLKNSKANGTQEIKKKLEQIKNFKDPNFVPPRNIETLDEKIRRAELDIRIGKSDWKENQAIIYLANLLKENKKSEAVNFLYKALRSLEFFTCYYPDYFKDSSIKEYKDLSIYKVIGIYKTISEITKGFKYRESEFFEKIGINENDRFIGKYSKDIIEKIIDVIVDAAGEKTVLDDLANTLTKSCSKTYNVTSGKRAYEELKRLKAEEEQNKTDINDKK